MKNEEKILSILESMQSDIKSLKDGQVNLEQGQANLEQGQVLTNSRLETLEQGQAITNSRLDEHYQILRALEHASTVHKADIDNLTHQVAGLSGGFKSIQKVQSEHTEQLERIENKVAGHDIKIEVLDRTKSNKRKIK
jgi:predicted  nucleic acid-binding Zn-ribbon protein